MSLTVVTERHFYRQDDLVRGCVRLSSNSPRAMSSVTITFVGKGTVMIQEIGGSKRKRNDQQTYFSFTQEIAHTEVQPSTGVQEWPFAFQIPRVVNPQRRHTDQQPWIGGDQPHALPPSFHFWHKNPYNETEWECDIDYELEAIASDGRLLKSNLFAKTSISYDQRRVEQSPNPTMGQFSRQYTIKTLRFLPEKAETKLSIGEKMQSVFKRSSLPSVDLQTTLHYPTCIYRGGPFPLQLMVVMSPTTFPRPTLYLRRVNVFVNSEVRVRTSGMLTDHTDTGDRNERLLEVKDLDIELPCDGTPFDLSMLGVDTSQLRSIFKSCNISVVSSLDLMVKVKSADKSVTMTVKAPVVVLPGL
jgi:hypothetical protein